MGLWSSSCARGAEEKNGSFYHRRERLRPDRTRRCNASFTCSMSKDSGSKSSPAHVRISRYSESRGLPRLGLRWLNRKKG